MQELDLLILGAGWTSTFLVPLLKPATSNADGTAQKRSWKYALTSTTGRDDTIKFKFDPDGTPDRSQFSALPSARYILVTFPVKSKSAAALLVDSYLDTHEGVRDKARWIVLGSTGIWQPGPANLAESAQRGAGHWLTRHSPWDRENARGVAEEEYLARGALVLNLSGLWDGTKRDPKTWVGRVATTKEAVAGKSSLHMIHGVDVARALLAILEAWELDRDGDEAKRCRGQRWMLTDGFVYDWWALFAGWADNAEKVDRGDNEPSKQSTWVYELMEEKGIKALPRSMEELGRCYDSREFWQTFRLTPLKARI